MGLRCNTRHRAKRSICQPVRVLGRELAIGALDLAAVDGPIAPNAVSYFSGILVFPQFPIGYLAKPDGCEQTLASTIETGDRVGMTRRSSSPAWDSIPANSSRLRSRADPNIAIICISIRYSVGRLGDGSDCSTWSAISPTPEQICPGVQ